MNGPNVTSCVHFVISGNVILYENWDPMKWARDPLAVYQFFVMMLLTRVLIPPTSRHLAELRLTKHLG